MSDTRRNPAFVLALGVALLSCDARLSPSDARHGPPPRAAWLVRLTAPGEFELKGERTVNGALLRAVVSGEKGRYEFSATLSGTACDGADGSEPVVDVRCDDYSITQWAVKPGAPSEYQAELALMDDPRRIDLIFTNDFATTTCDRNVSLTAVGIRDADKAAVTEP